MDEMKKTAKEIVAAANQAFENTKKELRKETDNILNSIVNMAFIADRELTEFMKSPTENLSVNAYNIFLATKGVIQKISSADAQKIMIERLIKRRKKEQANDQ